MGDKRRVKIGVQQAPLKILLYLISLVRKGRFHLGGLHLVGLQLCLVQTLDKRNLIFSFKEILLRDI